jgi:hypothetical protein
LDSITSIINIGKHLVLNTLDLIFGLPTFIYFTTIPVILIWLVIFVYVAGSEGTSNIPGSVYIPGYYTGTAIGPNNMPGRYAPTKPPKYYPGVTGPGVGQAAPVEPVVKLPGPPVIKPNTKL